MSLIPKQELAKKAEVWWSPDRPIGPSVGIHRVAVLEGTDGAWGQADQGGLDRDDTMFMDKVVERGGYG